MLQSNIISNLNKTLRSNFASPLDGSGGGGPVVNRYAQFNGTTDYATIPSVTHTTAAGTIMIRCKLSEIPTTNFKDALFEWSAIGGSSYYPYIDGTFYLDWFRTSRVDSIVASAIPLTDWHWLIVRDNAASGWECLQALDTGSMTSIATAAHQAWDTSPGKRYIGNNGGDHKLYGAIDRILVGDSRWSDAECLAVRGGGNGPGDVLVRYEFNEISSGKFIDSSGNGKDATITGSPAIEEI